MARDAVPPAGSPSAGVPPDLAATLAATLAVTLAATGQAHLVAHAATLDAATRATFLEEVGRVPWDRVARAFASPPAPTPPDLRPPEALTARRQANEAGLVARLADLGRQLLAAGKVAAVLLAGGQGSRLGFAGPKGTFVL